MMTSPLLTTTESVMIVIFYLLTLFTMGIYLSIFLDFLSQKLARYRRELKYRNEKKGEYFCVACKTFEDVVVVDQEEEEEKEMIDIDAVYFTAFDEYTRFS